jgi:fatty acid desaturase
METTPNPQREREARRYVKALREFYGLLMVAALVIALTGGVNLLTRPGRWWFLWVAFGMGVAVLVSGLRLRGRSRHFGADWEARQMRRYLERGQ